MGHPPFATVVAGRHRLALLRDGAQTFDAMIQAIRSARSYVCLETYILRDDWTGRRFAAALSERARAGVEVNLLYDAWGSSVSGEFLRQLHEAGVRTLAFHPLRFRGRLGSFLARLIKRDHRKVLVVDGRIGFTGGHNIADDYAPARAGGGGWRDTHLQLEGPAVAELLYSFLHLWRRHGGAPLDEGRYSTAGRRPDPRVRIVGNSLRGRRDAIGRLYKDAIRNARRRIRITNAYFVPTVGVIRAIRQAARRGVDVQLIVAGTTDVPAVRFASRALYEPYLKAGVRIFEWKGRVLHAKTATIDGHWSTVGSANLDVASLRVNLEVNAVVEDEGFARALERMFEEDLEHCEEITLEGWKARPFWEKLLAPFVLLLRRWL